MNSLYAESSAVVRWLLGTPDGPALEKILESAATVVTSALTSAEIGRTLRRLSATGVLTEALRHAAWQRYAAAAARWNIHTVTDDVLARAGEAFPSEPLRTLDAVHLATAAAYAREVSAPTVLSTDAKVRENAAALGLAVAP